MKLQTCRTKCPYLYDAMMHLAVTEGWNKAQVRAVLEDAISLEPGYYHTYRDIANYLQPKWYGAEGDVGAFADEISKRLGGSEGAFVYFEIATVGSCGSCGDGVIPAGMSWKRVKEGYAALESLYGVSNVDMNRFAFLATKQRDKEAARAVFLQLGDHWEQELWQQRRAFEEARSWALAN